jgi:hypothetical protein
MAAGARLLRAMRLDLLAQRVRLDLARLVALRASAR